MNSQASGFATSLEASTYLRLSKSLVCKLIAEEKIPARRYGRSVRVPWAWLHEQGQESNSETVTHSSPIAALREKLGYTQREMAESLGVTVTTISRYENGLEPSAKASRILAKLSDDAGASQLRDMFNAKWRGDVATKIDNLASEGSARRIPKGVLQSWSKSLESACVRPDPATVRALLLDVLADLSAYLDH